MKNSLLLIVIAIFMGVQVQSQDTTSNNFTVSADFVNNYVWRGQLFSSAPNVQPCLNFTSNSENLNIGAWGSYSLSDFYSEVDFYVDYTFGPITLAVWDYFTVQDISENKYFYYGDTTMHALEVSAIFSGPDAFPISLTVGTFVLGNDKDENGDNYYSTYLEAAYPVKWGKNQLDFALGFTPNEGLYGSKPAVCNVSIGNSREIQITDRFSIPVSGRLIVNPHLQNIYLVLDINISSNN